MRRVFVEAVRLQAGELELDDDEARYLQRVLRLGEGAAVELFDGEGRRAQATLVAVTRRGVRCQAAAPERDPEPPGPRRVSLLPLIKGERLDLAVRMLTELGVQAIRLFTCERGVVQLGEDGAARLQRLQRVALAATRQCGRGQLPELSGPSSLVELAEAAVGARYFGDTEVIENASPMAPVAGAAATITVCTGPEGGFAVAERQLLLRCGFQPLSLGHHVLRAETAAVVAQARWIAPAVGKEAS